MTIRVMSYNILDGGVGREALIQEVVCAVQPDLLILQEVFQASFVRDLAHILSMAWVFPSGNRRRRVALLSRLPLHAHTNYQTFPPIWRNSAAATIGCPSGAELHLFGVHPIANLAVPFEYWRWWELTTSCIGSGHLLTVRA